MTDILQNAAAEGQTVINPGTDPNTGLPETPTTQARQLTPEDESYEDMWAKAPTGDAPVRTWLDPAARAGTASEVDAYKDAWSDTPVTAAPAPAPGPGHQVEQLPAPAPAPAGPAAPAGPSSYLLTPGQTTDANDSPDGLLTDTATGKTYVVPYATLLKLGPQYGMGGNVSADALKTAGWTNPDAPPPVAAPAAPAAPVAPAPAAVTSSPSSNPPAPADVSPASPQPVIEATQTPSAMPPSAPTSTAKPVAAPAAALPAQSAALEPSDKSMSEWFNSGEQA